MEHEFIQIPQPANRVWDGTGQTIAKQIHLLQVYHLAQAGRNRATEGVVTQPEIAEFRQLTQAWGQRARD